MSTMAAAHGSSLAIAISGRSIEFASFVTVAYLSGPMTSSRVCWSGSVPRDGEELDRFDRIQIVEIHFHDDGVGRVVGPFELPGKLRVILRQSVHGTGQVDGVVFTLERPHRRVAIGGAPAHRRMRAASAAASPRARLRRINRGKVMPRILRQSGSARQYRWRRWSEA